MINFAPQNSGDDDDHESWQEERIAPLGYELIKNIKDAEQKKENLEYAYMSKLNLQNVQLEDAIMTNAMIEGANLEDANLVNANCRYTNFLGSIMRSANLTNANLQDADLTGVDLRFAVLTDTNLKNAVIEGADMRSIDIGPMEKDELKYRGAILDDQNWQDSKKIFQGDSDERARGFSMDLGEESYDNDNDDY